MSCQYGSNRLKLCSFDDCSSCFNRSFASIESSIFLQSDVNPRQILKQSKQKLNFYCINCKHTYTSSIYHKSNNRGCPYCCTNSRLLCNKEDCIHCYNRSFASHEKAKCWSNQNIKKPREVFKHSNIKYYIKCNTCSHDLYVQLNNVSNRQECGYCNSRLLCSDNDCDSCYKKSFASHPFSKFWSSTNNNKPRDLCIRANSNAEFTCNICNHSFNSRIADLKINKSNCPYCAKKKLCGNIDCKLCFSNSFASHPKAIYFSNKNNDNPRNIFIASANKYIFNCNLCNNEFTISLHAVTSSNNWCSICHHKTEKILYEWLKSNFSEYDIKPHKQFKGNAYRFDFYIEAISLLIELDGIQHFEQTSNWTTPESNLLNDINKIYYSITKNMTIIHLTQMDVLKNKNNWNTKLINTIKEAQSNKCYFIDNANIYKNHVLELNKRAIEYIII